MTSTTGLSLSKDFSNLNQDEYTQVKEELRLSRNILQNQNTGQRIPYLPTFSGDGGIALEHYISAIEAVKPTHSSHLLAQAIRKSVTGTAAKVINILDYTTPLSELISELKKNFQKVTGIATAWQKFYSASQTSKESLTDWRTRVHYLYHMTENKSDTDAHLKTKLFTGLFNNKLKEILLFKYRDDNASEDDLYQLLREESDKLSVISASVMSNEDTLTKKVDDLSKQLTALKTNQKSKMRTLQEDVDKHTLQLMEEEDTLSDTDENDDSCHCAYQMPRGRQNTSKRYDTQHQDQRRYPQAGYDRRYDTAKVPEQQSSDKQQHYRDDRRYNQRHDAHYNPSDDRLHNQSYDRQYNQSSDRPYYPSSDRRYNQSSDRPYGYQRDQHYMNRPYNYGHQREEERQFCGKPEYYGPQRYNYTYSDGNTNNNRPIYHNNHYQGRYDQRSDDDHTRQDFRDYNVQRNDGHPMENRQTSDANRQYQPARSDNSKRSGEQQKRKTHVSASTNKPKKKNRDFTSIQRRLIGRTNTDTIEVNGIECIALIDSGSVISSMSSKFHEEQFSHIPLKSIEDVFPEGLAITSATDHELNISGYLEANVLLPGLVTPVPILMTVLKSSILCEDMPILIGSNALEVWRSELDSNKNTNEVNPVVDRWKSEPSCVGIVKNVNYTQLQSHNCLFIQSRVKVSDIRPYNRKLLFVPFEKYANTISASTISVPRNTENISCELVTLPTKSKQCIRVPAGKRIGIMCPLKEEVLIPVNQQHNTNSERGKELLKSFNRTSWPEEICTKIENLITDYQDVFALSHHELGCFTDAKHRIELTDNTPIKQKYRRIPPHLFEAVKAEIQKMLENGVIRPSFSPYSSPLSIAIKKDGTPRICLDFRKINNITKRDAKAIPSVDEMIDLLYGKTTFSSLDLVQGFHQQELEESSKQYTAFNAGPLGLFEYQRLPFGITNATASFQRMMEYVLCDLVPSICLVYIDDVIVHSYTPSEHLESLRKVFDCLRFYNLKLKPSKCAFFKTELKFLGHVISDKGLKADPDKITAIKEWPQPKSVKQVRQFLGLSGFIRRYIKDYAIIARPITNLLRGYSNKKHSKNSNLKLEKEQFIWGKEQQAAFNKLKQVIAEDVTLAFPNFDLPFRLSCDASRNGLGGWLEQIQPDGKYRPIAFASRKTSNAERQYPVHKIEFLALKWCVTEKFRDYLYGKEVIIYTDNNPLTYILKKSTGLDATCQRWVSELEPYNFTIEYKPGVNNVVADSLSRIYDTEEDNNLKEIQKWAKERCRGFEDKDVLPIAATTVLDTIDYQPTVNFNWHTLQDTDHTISTLKKKILEQQPGETDNSPEVKQLLKYEQNLTVYKDLLYLRNPEDQQMRLVVPKLQQKEIVKIYHSFGHFGITRTYKTLKVKFFWINMKNDVIETISECERCQKAKTPPTKNKGPLNHLITPKYPFHQLSIDFLSIDTRAKTKFKILTCIDEFTKFAFAIPVKTENAKRCAEALYQQIYTKFGIPTIVHSDRGATFMSNIMKELNLILHIKHTVTTAYRPQSNGTCERVNSTIIDRIRTLQPQEKQRWNLHLDSLICAYNTTMHESIGTSPFYAMYGRHPKTPSDLLIRIPDVEEDSKLNSFADKRQKELRQSYELMAKNIEKRRKRSKKNYDDKIKKTTVVFNVGDNVLVRKFVRINKVDDRFQAEIHQVIKQKEDLPLYLVKGLESGTIKTIHRDNLVLFKQNSTNNFVNIEFENLETWNNMRHKAYDPNEDEEYSIKKHYNSRISIHFGKLIPPIDGETLKIEKATTIEHIQNRLKAFRLDSVQKCVIYIQYDDPIIIKKLLTSIRKEIHHNSWKKLVLSTTKHTIYNFLIKEMCTYFPKTPRVQQTTSFSESDDNSDDEYLIVRPDINEHVNEEIHEPAEDDEQNSTADDDPNSTDDDEDDVQPRYNFRHGRKQPFYLKDYVTFTFIPE